MPGRSCFLRVDDRVFHTYSSFARGLEGTGGSYYFLDLTALGRQEDWEEPKGRAESAREAAPNFLTYLTYRGTCSPNAPASRNAAVCSSP